MNTQIYLTARISALIFFIAAVPALSHAEFVVVVNAKNPVASLTTEQAAQIFLGKVGTFPNGEHALPLDQSEGTAIRNEFYDKVANKNPKQLLAFRANMVFSGKGQPPKELASSKDVKKLVADNPNAVGYIEKSAADDSVRIVLTQQ
jgi:ABC-type phosphate transport system substrate-binding protein